MIRRAWIKLVISGAMASIASSCGYPPDKIATSNAGQKWRFVVDFGRVSVDAVCVRDIVIGRGELSCPVGTLLRLESSCECVAVMPSEFRVVDEQDNRLTIKFEAEKAHGFVGQLAVDVIGWDANGSILLEGSVKIAVG